MSGEMRYCNGKGISVRGGMRKAATTYSNREVSRNRSLVDVHDFCNADEQHRGGACGNQCQKEPKDGE